MQDEIKVDLVLPAPPSHRMPPKCSPGHFSPELFKCLLLPMLILLFKSDEVLDAFQGQNKLKKHFLDTAVRQTSFIG